MNSLIKRPVIILGAPRGGTSILGRILQAHPAFVHIKEPRLIWRYRNDHRSDQLSAIHANPAIASYIRSRFAALAHNSAGERILEKTPSNSLRVPFVESVFPDAVYIHIMRNGFDSAASIRSYWMNSTTGAKNDRIGDSKSILRQRIEEASLRQIPYYSAELLRRFIPRRGKGPRTMWGPRLPGMKNMVQDMDIIEVAAMQWRQCVELAAIDGRALGPDRYMELRLEDLSLSGIESALNHVGLEQHDLVIENFETRFEDGKHRARRAELSDQDRVQIRRIVTPTMDWLGYKEPVRL